MLAEIHGIPQRIADLKRKREARDGKKEYVESNAAIDAEITRLEGLTQRRADLKEFIASNAPVASEPDQG